MPIVNLQPHLANEIGVESEISVDFAEPEIRLGTFLDLLFKENKLFRYSLTDETNAIRRHINVFVDNKTTKDLNSKILESSEIYIFQALSGG
jgi:molybdopterin converting factor small subunit